MNNKTIDTQTEESQNQKHITTIMRINTSILLIYGVIFFGFTFTAMSYLPDFIDWYMTLSILLVGYEVCYLLSWVITFPLRLWTYKMCTNRGLMNQKFKDWVFDWVKLLGLNLIIIIPLLTIIVFTCYLLKNNIIIAITTFAILAFILKFIRNYLALWLVHGFYRLKDGEKYEYWKDITQKNNIKNYSIYIVPIEHKTKYANAIAVGIKNIGYIVCFDTLLNNLSKEQFASIMAHESAHIINNDFLKRLFFMLILLIAYIIYIKLIFLLDPILLLAVTVVFLGSIIFILRGTGKRTQKQEHKADEFAARILNNKEVIIDGLKYIHEINKYPTEHKKKGNFKYHPTLKERIEYIQNLDLEDS